MTIESTHFKKLSATLFASLGAVCATLNRYKEAIDHLKKALDIDPNNPKFLQSLGMVYYLDDNPQASLICFYRCIQLNPNYTEVYIDRGVTYLYLKNYKKALMDFNTALMKGETDARIYKYRAQTYKGLGMIEESEADMKMYNKLISEKGE